MTMACNMYLLHLVFNFSLGWHMPVKIFNPLWSILIIQLLIFCPCVSSCFLIHILNCVFEPSSFYNHSFALGYLCELMNFLISGVLIDRYWRVFLNYQKTENVLTAKASRYTEVIWIVLFHELKQHKCLYSGN
jgi:hypothetical protein